MQVHGDPTQRRRAFVVAHAVQICATLTLTHPPPPTSCVLNFQNISHAALRVLMLKLGLDRGVGGQNSCGLCCTVKVGSQDNTVIASYCESLGYTSVWNRNYEPNFYTFFTFKSSQTFPGRPDDPSDLGNRTPKCAVRCRSNLQNLLKQHCRPRRKAHSAVPRSSFNVSGSDKTAPAVASVLTS